MITKAKSKAKSKSKKSASKKTTKKAKGHVTKRTVIPGDAVIKKLVKENPRVAGTSRAKRFDAYRSGMTVDAALASKRVTRSGLRTDIHEKLIAVR